MNASLKFFDLLIVIGALALGFGIWFVPNFSQSKEMKELAAAQREIRARNEAAVQAEARRAKEAAEQGLVYIVPPPAAAASGKNP